MLKRKELTDPTSCMSRAHDDEPTFVLLGRDPAAPAAIRAWSAERVRLGKNLIADRQMAEANATADLIEQANADYTGRHLAQPSGADLIARERERQKEKGYDAEHDDGHNDSSLLNAAMLLLINELRYKPNMPHPPDVDKNSPWPDRLMLSVEEKYKRDSIRRLTIAGAMVAAEIDRLTRLSNLIQQDGRTDLQVPE